jgi:D-alanyl-D-alanine carboxypeptidase/D-alanyl-D-alanine-endopeptidase (penicillin-binding protein 4)
VLRRFIPRLRFVLLLAVTGAFATPLVLPPVAEAQTKRKKKKTTVVQNRRKKPARSRSRVRESPVAPVAHYTSPRSSQALTQDLNVFLNRIRSGSWGVMITSLTRGDTLFSRNPGDQLRPASTLKLFTSALAFDRFGTEYQFNTTVLRDGNVDASGTLRGNLYLRGDGDPALSGRFMDGGPNAPMTAIARKSPKDGSPATWVRHTRRA